MADYGSICRQFEEQLGVKLKSTFFEDARAPLQSSRASGLTVEEQLHAMLAFFLECDMNVYGAGCFPPNIQVGVELAQPSHFQAQRRQGLPSPLSLFRSGASENC